MALTKIVLDFGKGIMEASIRNKQKSNKIYEEVTKREVYYLEHYMIIYKALSYLLLVFK